MVTLNDVKNLFNDISDEQYTNSNIANLFSITEDNNSVVVVKYNDGSENRIRTIDEIKSLVDNIKKS